MRAKTFLDPGSPSRKRIALYGQMPAHQMLLGMVRKSASRALLSRRWDDDA
jgi:hypothetical protein